MLSPPISLAIYWRKNVGLDGKQSRLFENFSKKEELITTIARTSAAENFFPQMTIFIVKE
jgi:hypothetical protein